ncbi:MAG: DNA polymerase I [Deltaproteobacteria bacterium]|jgi:DNA polymerase I-like protein with 3'-5' exonuclease and polymerase domains/5'-3' exonuclease|nr:DNA polymerase I [Deltaproteobacteria bacterium]
MPLVPTSRTLYLLDASSFIHRNFHAMRRMSYAGQPTGASFGFTKSVMKFMKDRSPEYLGVIYDSPGPNRRKLVYPAYKANRPPADPDLIAQLGPVKDIVDAMGLTAMEEQGFEADDVIAAYARKFSVQGMDVVILSGDKDFFQLLSERVSMLDLFTGKATDTESFREEHKLEPARFLDCQALMGDTSDNIPGIKGIGEKTAEALVREFGSLDAIFENLHKVKKSQQQKLREHEGDARISWKLALLGEGCPAEAGLEDFRIRDRDTARLRAIYEAQGFKSLMGDLPPAAASSGSRGVPAAWGSSGAAPEQGKDARPAAPGLGAPQAEAGKEAARPRETAEVDYSAYVLVTSEKEWKELEGELGRARAVAVDVETDSVLSATCGLVGLSLATGPNRAFYVPLGHALDPASGESNQDLGETLARLAPYLTDPARALCGQNAKFDWRILARFGLRLPAPSADPMLAAYLIDPDAQKSLDALSVKYLRHFTRTYEDVMAASAEDGDAWGAGEAGDSKEAAEAGDANDAAEALDAKGAGKAAESLDAKGPVEAGDGKECLDGGKAEEAGEGKEAAGAGDGRKARRGRKASGVPAAKKPPRRRKVKRTFADVGLRAACEYSAEDADLALRLAPLCEEDLAGDPALLALYREVELPLEDLLVSMELAGLKADPERLSGIAGKLGESLDALEARIWDQAGVKFNVGSPAQVAEVLFSKLGLKPVHRTAKKTAYSTDSSVLRELAPLHPVVGEILQHRETSKLKSTYADRLPLAISPATGRIHTTFNQTSTMTGRLSSSDPNLQNIPARTEEGRAIRECFMAEEGSVLVSCDYSQIELRIMAELSGDKALMRAFAAGADIHRETAAAMFGKKGPDVSPEERTRAKAINFGIIYGQGAYGLSSALRIPQSVAREFIERYFLRFPGIRAYMDRVKQEAASTLEVRTLFGRKRRLLAFRSGGHREVAEAERFAINTPVQGTAADLIKVAMLRSSRRLASEVPAARLVLQIHDELLCEAPEADAAAVTRIISEEMALAGSEPFFPGAPVMKVPLKVDSSVSRNWTHA